MDVEHGLQSFDVSEDALTAFAPPIPFSVSGNGGADGANGSCDVDALQDVLAACMQVELSRDVSQHG